MAHAVPQLCSNPFAPRVSNSLGVSAFSGSARPTCESINRFWPLYISAANQLSLWSQPANYETGFEVCLEMFIGLCGVYCAGLKQHT